MTLLSVFEKPVTETLVTIAVLAVIMAGIAVYLVVLNVKINKLEKKVDKSLQHSNLAEEV
ncbi:MAG: hypothetical protein RQ866_01155 [Bacteroidales bacterium]|nr:hypothetical protein [Bacteroidales bacterium]